MSEKYMFTEDDLKKARLLDETLGDPEPFFRNIDTMRALLEERRKNTEPQSNAESES